MLVSHPGAQERRTWRVENTTGGCEPLKCSWGIQSNLLPVQEEPADSASSSNGSKMETNQMRWETNGHISPFFFEVTLLSQKSYLWCFIDSLTVNCASRKHGTQSHRLARAVPSLLLFYFLHQSCILGLLFLGQSLFIPLTSFHGQ